MPKNIDLRPVRQIAAHELAVDQIRRALDLGQFRPGEHLPSERDLSDMLDLSRTTVRAAVAVLEHEGRISVRRGRGGGFLVLEPEYDPAAARRDLRLNRVALRDEFDYRVVVETGAARLAAERRRVSDLAPLIQPCRADGRDASIGDQGTLGESRFGVQDARFVVPSGYRPSIRQRAFR